MAERPFGAGRRRMQKLTYSSALNQLAEVALGSDEPSLVLDAMASVVGAALQVDRSMVYDVRLNDAVADCLAEWLRPEVPEITATKGVYPLSIFGGSVDLMWAERGVLTSDRSAPHPALGAESVPLLHVQMGVGSLLWLPFAFRLNGFHLLVFNQLDERRWDPAEVAFMEAASRQVSLALVKLELTAERRRTLEALASSEARYRELYNLTPAMFFTIDSSLTITAVNRFALEQLGYDEGDLLGTNALDAVPAEDREFASGELRRCLASPGRVIRWESRGTRKDGSVMVARQTGRTVSAPDGTRQIFIDAVDVTEQKQTERALLQSQKFETLGLLVGGIAHDFNNLLGTISGNAELALVRLPSESTAREPVQQAAVASVRAAELVRQLLSYSVNAPVSRERVQLNDLVVELTALLDVTVGKRATMVLDLAADLPPVMADPTQLRQVLMNLVHNAADSIDGIEGEVRIRTDVLRASEAAGRRVVLAVSDTGAGIESAVLSRIFEPFFTTKVAGRGLGLAAVRTIAERHGGTIEVESTPGRGSTFRLVIPASALDHMEAPQPLRAVLDPAPPSRGSVILVVDDERALLDVVGAFIEEFGDIPLLANNVAEAKRTFEAHPDIACALLDLTMPSGGGAVLARAFKELRPAVPIVLMSGFAQTDVTESLRGLLDAVIAKPFAPGDLQKVLARALGR